MRWTDSYLVVKQPSCIKNVEICHWMESSRSLTGGGRDGSSTGLCGDSRLREMWMWHRGCNWSCTAAQFNLHKPPSCREAYRLCWVNMCISPFRKRRGFNDSWFRLFLFLPLSVCYRHCSCSSGRIWVDSVHVLKQVFCWLGSTALGSPCRFMYIVLATHNK